MELEGLGPRGRAAGLCLCTVWLPLTAHAEPGAAAPTSDAAADERGAAREGAATELRGAPKLRAAPKDAGERDAGERDEGERGPAVEGPAEAPGIPAPQGWTGLMLRGDRSAGAGAGPVLRPIGGGRLLHDAGVFTATIAADGSVAFTDVMMKPKVMVMGFDLLTGKRVPAAAPSDAFAERAVAPFGPTTAAMFAGFSVGMPGLADMLVGARNVTAKARFLRETEALRARMAHAWLKQRLAEQLDGLVSRVMAIWRDETVPLAERRRRIFVAWDECDEARGEPGSPAEEVRAEAATRARERIERLVRMIAPPGSPQQFTPAELERWNARRRSQRRFEPYARAR